MAPAKRAFVKPGRAKPFWYGHPWVFSEAISSVEGAPAPGEEIDLCDEQGRCIGRGLFNPRSQIRVRLLASPQEPLDRSFWKKKISSALSLRREILGLPSAETDAYRLINAEGDGLSGMTVDLLGKVAVVQLTSLGLHLRREELFDVLWELLEPEALLEAASPGPQSLEGFSVQPGLRRGRLPESGEVSLRENGLRYLLDPVASQKTGFYCDQRENRRRVASLSGGRRVLDLYCFVGGFSLNACQGGASEVTLVDASARALSQAKNNLTANGFTGHLIEEDVPQFLSQVKDRFELVVVDPPKFAQRAKDKHNALQGYRKLNALALKATTHEGIFVSCSCSGLVSEEEFLRALGEAAYDARRTIEILWVSGAGPDHPLRLPWVEGRYLKCVIARVS